MKCLAYALAVAAATTALAADKRVETTTGDEQLIQGTWEIVSSIDGGRPQSTDELADIRVSITADLFVFQKGTEKLTGFHYTLDPSKKPRAIDTSHELDPGKPIVELGIYSLEGDTLKLCLEAVGKPRPTALESGAGESTHSFVLKRVEKKCE